MGANSLTRLREYVGAHRSAQIAGNDQRRMAGWQSLIDKLRSQQPDNIAGEGFKVYSQNDEDGIIEAIFDRLESNRTFIEIGVQDGTECNTHYLLLKGWRGAWIEASEQHCKQIVGGLGGNRFGNRFQLVSDFVKAGNVASLYREICGFLDVEEVAFYSLDIDSNDLYVLRALLQSGARPQVVCVEYNGKFPPPFSISVTCNENRGWEFDDYFGASFQAFADVLAEYGYKLVTCSVVGANAFFVRGDHAGHFAPLAARDAWQRLKLYLAPLPSPHRPSIKFLRDRLEAPD